LILYLINMRHLFVLAFLISTVSFGQKKECDCYKYYTGKFYSTYESKGKIDTLYITRTKTEQTEKTIGYNKTFKVIWLSSCKFVIRDYSIRSNEKKLLQGDVISKIVATTSNSYITKAWQKGNKKMPYTIYKLEE